MTTETKDEKKKTRGPKRDAAAIAADLEARLKKLREKERLEKTPGLKELIEAQSILGEAQVSAKGTSHEMRIAGLRDALDSLVTDLAK